MIDDRNIIEFGTTEDNYYDGDQLNEDILLLSFKILKLSKDGKLNDIIRNNNYSTEKMIKLIKERKI